MKQLIQVFFIGDIVGAPGRKWVMEALPELRKAAGWDLVIANAENAAGGAGLTGAIANDLLAAGVDGITLGDHVWDQRGFDREIDELPRVCRPFNLPEGVPGQDHLVVETADGFRLGLGTLLGGQFMKTPADGNAFRAADRLLDLFGRENPCDAVLVEFHAETTSEKIAMGWHLDGRAAIIVGTHTHVPTADTTLLPRGSAYITDVGMTGPYASILGRSVEPVLLRFLDGLPRRFTVAEEAVRLMGLEVTIDRKTGFPTRAELRCFPAP
ncbi:MAG: TIGR00282 family metallophosphoesterase [Opitutales bacterium]